MQTSMGQAATMFNSFLDMYVEERDGSSEELIEAQLLEARKGLVTSIRTSGDHTASLNRLLVLKCPVSMKYVKLNVRQLLKDNNESVGQLKAIVSALGVLEKYGRHLLKPPGARVEQWRLIKFNNSIFKDRVLPMVGAVEVVQQLGYTDDADCGLQFSMGEPDPEATGNLVADILLARTEMEMYLKGEHPHPETIHSLLPESTVNQVVDHWDQYTGAGTVNINPPAASLTSQQLLNPPTPVSASSEAETEFVDPVQTTDPPPVSANTSVTDPPVSHPQEDCITKACDICGDRAATLWCRLCDNKQLCKDCDEMWHRHPKRLNHERDPIASFPCASSTQPQDPIMGPFGIRAVDSFSSQSNNDEHSPTPVSGSQYAGNARDRNSRTPPPQQIEPMPPPSASFQKQHAVQQGEGSQHLQPAPLNPSTSIQMHQQQLQYYLQQQQLLQQQQQLQPQRYSAPGSYPMPQYQNSYNAFAGNPRLPQPSFASPVMQSGPGNEMPLAAASTASSGYPAVSIQNAMYPPFPVLDHDPVSQRRVGDDTSSAHPSVLAQQSTGHGSHSDLSTLGPLPGAVGGAPVAELSLRHRAGRETMKRPDSASVAESSLFGTTLDRRSSVHRTSLSTEASLVESSLLKTVLAESNYEKRAAKCDIRLLTLEEELEHVDMELNDLMLNADDITERSDFLELNRRKARLMKEHKALSNYKKELADIMSSETPHGSDPSAQIFHPPPLSSAPSTFGSFPSPQATSAIPPVPSPTQQQQLGFSYPHQASQSPVNPQEPTPVSAYQAQSGAALPQGFYGNSQVQVGQTFPYIQESIAHNTLANANSSVDRSSILPQWQMMPAVSSVSSPADPNQVPVYAPPRYQQGDVSSTYPHSSTDQSGFPTFSGMNQMNSPLQGFEGQGISVAPGRPPLAQEPVALYSGAHMPPVPGTQPFREQNHQHMKGPSCTTPVNVSQPSARMGGGPIGFENIMKESYSVPQSGAHRSFGTHAQPSTPPRQKQRVTSAQSVMSSPSVVQPLPPVAQSPQKFDVPSQNWACSHCTYINTPGTRVCDMCNRTSDNPDLVRESGEVQMSTVETSQAAEHVPSLMSAPLEEATALSSAIPRVEAVNMNQQNLANFHSRIAEEQDQVYLEKKEAHKQYYSSQSQQNQGQNNQQRMSSPPSDPPPPLPATVITPPPRPAVPQRRPSSTTTSSKQPSESGSVEGQNTSVGSSQNADSQRNSLQTSQNKSGEGERINSASEIGSRVGGNSEGGSLDSSSFVQEENFLMTMERFSEQRKIKQQQLDGADYMHYVKMADRQGFQLGEMQAALLKCNGNFKEALKWLRTDWNKLVQVVISSTRAAGQQLDHNDVGDLSTEEAEAALRASKGDMIAAVNSCVASRKQLYSTLNPDGTYAREEVLQAMLQSCGKEDAAHEQLRAAALQPFLDRVWKERDGEETGVEGNSRLLQPASSDTTCHSCSTSVISHADFQQTIMNQNVDRDRRVRMILVEGKLRSWGRADMAIKLLDVDLPNFYPPADQGAGEASPYTLEDVVEAVRNCRDRQSARVYLTQECSTCFSHYPMSKIRNLYICQCKICLGCLKQNFEVVIREKHVRHWTCPICGQPDLNDTEIASEYLSFLGLLLQAQVDKEVYELFETKMRDWHLQKDPNFRWCAHCGNGFIANENQLRMQCPYCNDKTCYGCKKQWEDQHEGLTCAQFAQWKIDNDPNNQAVGLARHLEENGIDCPSCKMRYALAKGGCMHFKCPQCGHEFCSGCYQPFYQRGMCPSRLKSCKTSGLHAHHPRDCFFYLRDEDIDRLQSLLRDSNVQFNTVPPESQEDASHCPVIEQKEFDSGKSDESCGKDTVEGHAGLCLSHYKEYLVGLINKNHIDPVVKMTVEELKKLVKRAELSCPKLNSNDSEANYRKRLMKFVNEKIPLPARGP